MLWFECMRLHFSRYRFLLQDLESSVAPTHILLIPKAVSGSMRDEQCDSLVRKPRVDTVKIHHVRIGSAVRLRFWDYTPHSELLDSSVFQL